MRFGTKGKVIAEIKDKSLKKKSKYYKIKVILETLNNTNF